MRNIDKAAFAFLAVVMMVGVGQTAQAETIEFPDEELATESVLPVFETPDVVKKRNVQTEKRFELGGGVGLSLTEALYNNLHFGIQGTYHLTNDHAINATIYLLQDGLSDNGVNLKLGRGLAGVNRKFDASLVPHPLNSYWASYQFTAYYGKISITKKFTMNLSLFAVGGLGMVNFGDSNEFGLTFGIGQNFYFTKNFSLRFDLRMMSYMGPDPTTAPKDNSAVLKSSQVRSSQHLDSYLTIGANFLL